MVRKASAVILIAVFVFYALACAQIPAETVAPDFKLKDLYGNDVSLSSFKGKDIVLLLFWATWCPYCKNELKELDAMDKEGLKVLAVDVGETEKAVSSFVGRHNIGLTVLLDKDMSVTDSYGIIGVPFYLLIDKEGVIRFSNSYFPQKKYKELSSGK